MEVSGLVYPICRITFFDGRSESFVECLRVEELFSTQWAGMIGSITWGYDPLSDTFPAKCVLAWKYGGHLGGLGAHVWLVADLADALVFWEARRDEERELA